MADSDRPRTILVLGAGEYQLAVFERLRAAGFRAVAVDRDPDAPGFAVADEHAIADVADLLAVLEVARAHDVSGVMSLNEFGVRSAAHATAALGLPGNTPETALAATDKGHMRERWQSEGVSNPPFRVAAAAGQARAAWRE